MNIIIWGGYIISDNLKDEFKKLFYSTLTESEIKKELGLTHTEYKVLLKDIKKELGLPSEYRRRPHLFDKYTKYSYYILQIDYVNDKYNIVAYRPSENTAKSFLEDLNNDNPFVEYRVEKATDENLSELIHHEFYIKNRNWEEIMINLKLPYHKFYELLNNLKKMEHTNSHTNRNSRFVYYYAPTSKFVIKKRINGKSKSFGYYDDKETAIRIRDYLESVNWDVNLFEKIKNTI